MVRLRGCPVCGDTMRFEPAPCNQNCLPVRIPPVGTGPSPARSSREPRRSRPCGSRTALCEAGLADPARHRDRSAAAMARAGATGRGGVRRFTPNDHARASREPSARRCSGDGVGDIAPERAGSPGPAPGPDVSTRRIRTRRRPQSWQPREIRPAPCAPGPRRRQTGRQRRPGAGSRDRPAPR